MEAIYSGRLTGIDPDTGLYSFQLRPDAEINTATDLNKFDNYQFYLGTGEAPITGGFNITAEYKGVTLIENPYWDSCNNIASLYVAREQLENAMILDGDQMVYKKEILAPEFTRSGYNAIWTDAETDEWLMQVENGIVRSCSRTGGRGGWQLFSVSRWSGEDGKRLKKHLELEFEEKKNRQIYWDDVAMFCHFREYELGIYPMQEGDLIEIDDFSELCDLDPSYCGYEAQGQEKSEEK